MVFRSIFRLLDTFLMETVNCESVLETYAMLFQYQECVLYLALYSASKLDYFCKLLENTVTMQSTIQFPNSNRGITVPRVENVWCTVTEWEALHWDLISGHEAWVHQYLLALLQRCSLWHPNRIRREPFDTLGPSSEIAVILLRPCISLLLSLTEPHLSHTEPIQVSFLLWP